ncbi:MAG: DEAD/DEAH box helicase [Bacteriovoracaceae bacterium]|nr:DEAD/DEAH box helicase [Bacteriovoracaceae bacterium]
MELNPVHIEKSNVLLKYFPVKYFEKIKNLIESGKISISFQKGNLENYFIASGIILESPKLKTRVSYKKEEDAITGACSCKEWNETENCAHVAALMYSALNHETKASDGPYKRSLFGQGVGVEKYGEIIWGAQRLDGAPSNATYSSLQYTLTNQQNITFPIVKDFHEKLLIELKSASELPLYRENPKAQHTYYPTFKYINQNGETFEQVSLFEYLYIFNWKTGEAFHQPAALKDLVRKIKGKELLYDINDYLRLTRQMREKGQCEILIDGQSTKEFKQESMSLRFYVNKSKRKNHLDLNLEFFDSEDRKIDPPQVYRLLTYNNGGLNSFRTKNDANEFLKFLVESFTLNQMLYKKFTHGTENRTYISEWFDELLTQETLEFHQKGINKIFIFDSFKIKETISALFTIFGENAYRFSTYYADDRKIIFEILKGQFFNGVTSFFTVAEECGFQIFYNDHLIANWKNSIRFERRNADLNWFELNMNISEDDLQIIQEAEIGDGFVLKGDQLILLSNQEKDILKFMKKYTKFEAKSEEAKAGERSFRLSFNRARIFELFELRKLGIDGALTPSELTLCENLLNLKEMPQYPVPAKFVSIARTYQITGYQWLRFLFENKFGACLADDMGLGKTLQTIMFLESIIDKVNKVLIVCPVSILMNWQNEIKKFSSLDIGIYYGEEREFPIDKKIILTSYGIMKKEAPLKLQETRFDIVIFDEVQQLKNIRSLGANSARTLTGDFRICLTGTPVENDISEFYNIMDIAIPGVWGELAFLRTNSQKKSRLMARQTVRPFIMRRTKAQVLTELPEKTEQHVYLNFESEEKQNYIKRLVQIKEQMKAVLVQKKYGEVLKNLLELRQLCLWQKLETGTQSTKVNFLIETLGQVISEGHKVIVFSQFTTYLDLIQREVKKHDWKMSRIDGTQNIKKREKEVQNFQEGDSQVFLISLKAGGFGLNLTAASYIFLMDPWWNPAVENQAIDRAYRIGQKNNLTVYRPIIKDSIEEKVLILQQAKKELFKDLMAEDDEAFYSGKLTMTDFQSLLS